ncbi:MAG: DoxX family protein [Ferruginibacter sp.]|nr:DoxX family protein [Cytophagales bacterium]
MTPQPRNWSNARLAAGLLRLGLGVDFFMHGAVRVPKLAAFADGLVKQFAATILPAFAVRGFALLTPIVEVLVGLLLLAGGRWLRWGAVLGGLQLTALIFGSALREEWANINVQLVHLLALYVLLRSTNDEPR